MSYSIGETCEKTGLSADTLRYYERIGLLRKIERNSSGQRRYTDSDLAQLGFIQRSQSMDFSLAEIADLLALRNSQGDVKSEVRAVTEQKLAAIDEKIATLQKLRSELADLVSQCRASEGVCCPIIKHMDNHEDC